MSFRLVVGATLIQQLWRATTTLTIEASIFRDPCDQNDSKRVIQPLPLHNWLTSPVILSDAAFQTTEASA